MGEQEEQLRINYTFPRGGRGSKFHDFSHQGGGASAQKIHLTECSTREVCGAAHLFHHGRRDEGGSVGTGSTSRLSEELMGSLQAQYGGARRRRRRVDLPVGYKPLRGLTFLNSFLEIDR